MSELEGADAFFGGFYDALIETTHATATDDAVWFVPRDYNALVVYYNQTLFDAAGVALPQQGWTWTDFENTCAQLMASGQVLKAVEYDMAWPPFSLTMMANYGSKYFNDDGTIALRSDETQACFNMLQEFNTKYAQQGTGGGFAQYTEGGKNIGMFIDVRPSLPEIAAVAAASGWKLGAVSFLTSNRRTVPTATSASGAAATPSRRSARRIRRSTAARPSRSGRGSSCATA